MIYICFEIDMWLSAPPMCYKLLHCSAVIACRLFLLFSYNTERQCQSRLQKRVGAGWTSRQWCWERKSAGEVIWIITLFTSSSQRWRLPGCPWSWQMPDLPHHPSDLFCLPHRLLSFPLYHHLLNLSFLNLFQPLLCICSSTHLHIIDQ